MMAYISSVQASTGFTPNQFMFGLETCLPLSVLREPNENVLFLLGENYLEKLDDIMPLSFRLVREHLKTAQLRQKKIL